MKDKMSLSDDNKVFAGETVSVSQIPKGVRVRTDSLLTLDITSFAKDDLKFTLSRLLGFEGTDRGYEPAGEPEETGLSAGESEVVFSAGEFDVIVKRGILDICIKKEGRVLTSIVCGGLGYERCEIPDVPGGYPVSLSAQLTVTPTESIWGSEVFPVVYSDRGYILFCDHREGVSFFVPGEESGRIMIRVAGERLTFHLISGKDAKETVGSFKRMTGMPDLPAAADFSPWLFADPLRIFEGKTADALREEGFRICVNAGPFVRQDDVLFEEGLENGYFAEREDGRGVIQEERLPGAPALIDITKPDAVSWYFGKVKELLDKGADGISSYYPEIFNGNLTGLDGEAAGDLSVPVFSANPDVDTPFVIYRTGSQNADLYSMAQSLRTGLSAIFSGASYFCHEIPGDRTKGDLEAVARWIQFGCFSTHFGIGIPETENGGGLFEGKESEVFKKFSGIKNMLMPYLYEQALQAHENGFPVVRPMALAFPEDPACVYLDLQYMLGESILVAPVFEKGGRSRFYLPSGRWKNLLDDEILDGPGFYDRTYDLLHMAVFVRENSLLPVGGSGDGPDYDYTKGLTVHYFLPVMGKGVVLEIPDTGGNRVMSFKGFYGGEKAEVRMLKPTGMGKVPVTVHHPDGTEENGYSL